MTASATLRRSVLALGALVLHAQVAAARPEYPGRIKDTLQLDCSPTCLMCHTTMEGGTDNFNKYGESIGIAIINSGPEGVYAPDGQAATKDFDGDGVFDRDEVIANTDPGSKEPVGICSDATYGCGAQVAPGGALPTTSWGLVAALGVAALLLRKLRRA